jgi:ATP/maltotriose-dependent transcriptional regulator MalT
MLVESLSLARELNDRANIYLYMADLAGVWASQGEPVRAAKVFGAAEALRESVGVIMYEGQRIAYESDVARGAAQLEAAEWKAAWAEGRAMPLDEACALAVDALPARDTPEGKASPMPQETYNLSERELEVLRCLTAGMTYAEIAEHLMLSFHTVHAHLRAIYGKLGVASRGQAARFAIEHGLAPNK